MIIQETDLRGLYTVTPELIGDPRGFFTELYRKEKFAARGLNLTFAQENLSHSEGNVLRGLHFQWDEPLGKFVDVVSGAAFAVAVDIRKNSATLAQYRSFELTAKNKLHLYLPPGFAFGFCVLGGMAEVHYLYTAPYNPKGESNIIWNDSAINIAWPIANPLLSERDKNAQTLSEWLARPESGAFTV